RDFSLSIFIYFFSHKGIKTQRFRLTLLRSPVLGPAAGRLSIPIPQSPTSDFGHPASSFFGLPSPVFGLFPLSLNQKNSIGHNQFSIFPKTPENGIVRHVDNLTLPQIFHSKSQGFIYFFFGSLTDKPRPVMVNGRNDPRVNPLFQIGVTIGVFLKH